MNMNHKLDPVPWELTETRLSRHFNKGRLICNEGVYDFFSAMKEGKFIGNLFVGTNWNPNKEPIIVIFMAQEMRFLERCISAVGEQLSYSAYMIADEFEISDENELCNNVGGGQNNHSKGSEKRPILGKLRNQQLSSLNLFSNRLVYYIMYGRSFRKKRVIKLWQKDLFLFRYNVLLFSGR